MAHFLLPLFTGMRISVRTPFLPTLERRHFTGYAAEHGPFPVPISCSGRCLPFNVRNINTLPAPGAKTWLWRCPNTPHSDRTATGQRTGQRLSGRRAVRTAAVRTQGRPDSGRPDALGAQNGPAMGPASPPAGPSCKADANLMNGSRESSGRNHASLLRLQELAAALQLFWGHATALLREDVGFCVPLDAGQKLPAPAAAHLLQGPCAFCDVP